MVLNYEAKPQPRGCGCCCRGNGTELTGRGGRWVLGLLGGRGGRYSDFDAVSLRADACGCADVDNSGAPQGRTTYELLHRCQVLAFQSPLDGRIPGDEVSSSSGNFASTLPDGRSTEHGSRHPSRYIRYNEVAPAKAKKRRLLNIPSPRLGLSPDCRAVGSTSSYVKLMSAGETPGRRTFTFTTFTR